MMTFTHFILYGSPMHRLANCHSLRVWHSVILKHAIVTLEAIASTWVVINSSRASILHAATAEFNTIVVTCIHACMSVLL